ncbi:MAG: LPP20 family lipoprotein [Chitinivibrionales bacterium]|nr:LPP20 family lipoprotein [Chitinivibrionales bacterium]
MGANNRHSRTRILLLNLVLLCLSLWLIDCAGTKPGSGFVDNIPDELQNLIKKQYGDAVYAVGTSADRQEGIATRKATLQARAELARQFQMQIDVMQKTYEEAVNEKSAEDYMQVIETFATLEVSGSQIAKSLVRQEKDGSYTAKVLVVISAQQLKNVVDEKMSNYTTFKASKAYKELEERVEREKAQRLQQLTE